MRRPADRGWAQLSKTSDDAADSVPALGEMSDAWLVGRARELVAIAQECAVDAQLSASEEVDLLLAEADHRGEPRMVGQLLRAAALVKVSTPGMLDMADEVIDELLTHSRRYNLRVLQAGTHALRARRALLGGNEDFAITEIVVAIAMLDEEDLAADVLMGQRQWERLLAAVLTDIGGVLISLGVYELADKIMTRAHQRVRENGGPQEIASHLINRVRLLVRWGLWLERVGSEQAGHRFRTAAAIATSVEDPWRASPSAGRKGERAAEELPVVASAHAMANPGRAHIDRLRQLLGSSYYAREQLTVSIALARCLEYELLLPEAVEVLATARRAVEYDKSDPALRLSLFREYARLAEPGGVEAHSVLERYALALERELWSLRDTRLATLQTRLDHERLSRKHGAITQQALQDPLTGLPNRRALDEHLGLLMLDPSAKPLSIALVDLDGFKGVNDQFSHAEGDDVLRLVAATLRDALRGDDLVARYGGDEFVVLLPGAPSTAAEAALRRAVEAVDELPEGLCRGVRLSIGVVSARAHEGPDAVLARADAAMYLAKRRGGNQVAAPAGDPSVDLPSSPAWLAPGAP